MPASRPLPLLDGCNRAFWTGGAHGKLLIMHCADCDGFIHPPRPVCRHCRSVNVAPKAVAGTGTVETLTVKYQAWLPGLDVPFVIARVSVDGAPGVLLTTNIVNCPVEDAGIGDKVKVVFEAHGEIHVPLFEKITSL
jgi:uncharacterized OB-fold protein